MRRINSRINQLINNYVTDEAEVIKALEAAIKRVLREQARNRKKKKKKGGEK